MRTDGLFCPVCRSDHVIVSDEGYLLCLNCDFDEKKFSNRLQEEIWQETHEGSD